MVNDVWDYFVRFESQCRDLGLVPDTGFEDVFIALEGSKDTRGRVFGRFSISDRAFLSITEVVTIQDRQPVRDEYAYYLIIDGAEQFARDCDAAHGPHGHGPGHRREPAPEVSLKEFVEQAWQILSRAEWAPKPDDADEL